MRYRTWQEIQQGWQTSAVAMLSCIPFSIRVRHLLPTSNIDILVYYLFSRRQWTSCVRAQSSELWIQFSWLTFPLRWIPVNNRIKLITRTKVSALHFYSWQCVHSSVNFRTVFVWKQHANLLDAEHKTDFSANGHSSSFKVIYFDVTEKPLSE